MNSLWLISHFGSCNMGDKYQMHHIYDYIHRHHKNIDMKLINFGDFKEDRVKANILGTETDIYSPKSIRVYDCNYVIVTTGSFTSDSPHVPLIKSILEKGNKLKKLFIWGGFSGISLSEIKYKDGKLILPSSARMEWLKDERVEFYARSQQELDLFRKITETNKGKLGGDPMVFWNINIKDENSINLKDKVVLVLSIYGYKFLGSRVQKLIDIADVIIFNDNYADRETYNILKSKKECYVIVDPVKYINTIKNAKVVYSTRLHGAVLSACANVPTVIIPSDNARPGERSFKFHAVASTALGDNSGELCNIRQIEDDISKYETYLNNVKKYKDLTFVTLNTITKQMK